MENLLSYFGPLEAIGHVYNIINHNITSQLTKSGYKVVENYHTYNKKLTPLALQHQYPPRKLNIKHNYNVCLTAWEFKNGFPISRRKEIQNNFDLLLMPSQWCVEECRLTIPTKAIYWGLDQSFYNQKKYQPYKGLPADKIKILWVGGTDKRHGFDIALQVIEKLPDNYVLVAKQSAFYPKQDANNPRVIIIRDDLPSLIPLYKACDVFLQTARGVGFSLPTLEALACDLPVVSTPLPPIQEFKYCHINFSTKGEWQRASHHLYSDGNFYWFEPDINDIIDTILNIYVPTPIDSNFMNYYSWASAVTNIMEIIK